MREHHLSLTTEFAEGNHANFSRLFPDLEIFEPEENSIRELGKKGGIMEDTDFGIHGDAKVRSAGITFLGQFITHDITFDKNTGVTEIKDPEEIANYRTPALDLDCIYGLGREGNPELYDERDPALFKIGVNDQGKSNDLPREKSGIATIGDPRNDNTIIIAQLHLAFLKFHNQVVMHLRKDGNEPKKEIFGKAQEIVRWHYQWIVLNYFLPQVVDKTVIADILSNGRKYYLPEGRITIPVEFSVAAFRFGHSIVKPNYVMNDVFGASVFPPNPEKSDMSEHHDNGVHHPKNTSDSNGQNQKPTLIGMRKIKEEEVVQWRFFFWLDPTLPIQLGRKIDHKIARPLFDLPFLGDVDPHLKSLPFRTLLRGKNIGLPSGERVAKHMGINPLSKEQIGLQQLNFTETPLWYYILKEAELQHDGEKLGTVGGRIVAEVLIGLLEKDPKSFLNQNHWKPFLNSAIPGDFTMEDLLRFAGVADNKANQYSDRDSKKRYKKLKKYRKKNQRQNKERKDK